MLCFPEWYIIINKPVIIEACDNDNYNSPSCGHLEHNQRQALPEPELPYSQLDSEGYISVRFASKFTNNSDSSLKFACKIRTICWGFNILNDIWRQSKVNSKCVTRSHQIKYLLRLVHNSNSQANKQEKVHAL